MSSRFSQLCFGVALCGAVFAGASPRGQAPKVAATSAIPKTEARQKPYRVTRRITLGDARINESSGLCRSVRHENFLWTHNDSGDVARLFLLDESGNTRAVALLEGAKNLDWEDAATGAKDASGNAWIYVGDIGDNESKRDNITIYRFREPQLSFAGTRALQNSKTNTASFSQTSQTDSRSIAARENATMANATTVINAGAPQLRISCEAMTLRYPDGAHDAETLLVAPDGRILLVTKSAGGSAIFLCPQPFQNGASQTLREVGKVQFSGGGFFGLLATGGDISANGTRVVVRTYTHVYEWKRDAKDNSEAAWRALFRRAPQSFEAPEMAQSEAVCYDARGKLFLNSEKLPAPLVQMERR